MSEYWKPGLWNGSRDAWSGVRNYLGKFDEYPDIVFQAHYSIYLANALEQVANWLDRDKEGTNAIYWAHNTGKAAGLRHAAKQVMRLEMKLVGLAADMLNDADRIESGWKRLEGRFPPCLPPLCEAEHVKHKRDFANRILAILEEAHEEGVQ